jgi:hypothetical protein
MEGWIRLLEALTRLVDTAPWIAVVFFCFPGAIGLTMRSAAGTITGAGFGLVAGFIVGVTNSAWPLSLWLFACLVALFFGVWKRRDISAERRHQEFLSALRDNQRIATRTLSDAVASGSNTAPLEPTFRETGTRSPHPTSSPSDQFRMKPGSDFAR